MAQYAANLSGKDFESFNSVPLAAVDRVNHGGIGLVRGDADRGSSFSSFGEWSPNMTLLQGLAIATAVVALGLGGALGLVYWAFSDYPTLDEGC